jgi:uncharacterized protein involved in response to NO
MAGGHDDTKASGKHATFHPGFIWAALAAALGAGLPLGTHLTFVLGFGFPPGHGFASFVQTHGHVQLIGWAGLFIMGISLHFVPRLAGVPIARPPWLGRILWFMAAGLVLRSVSQAMLPYLTATSVRQLVAWLVAVSGGLEWLGILLYVGLLLSTLRRAGDIRQRPALRAVRPYFGMMVSGWLLYACLNLGLLTDMMLAQAVVVHQAWQHCAIESFLGLVLLPVAFASSVRMLPLYLRLTVADWPVRGTAYAYLVAVLVHVIPSVPYLLRLAPQAAADLSHLGMLLKGGVILWFVWQLDVLTRRRDPWTVHRKLHPGPERRPTRPGLSDYGEFGHFDRLISLAYVWLVLAAVCEAVSGIVALTGGTFFISSSAIRHMYLMGFITQLIFGMAVRMLPGFLQQRRVASPALVGATLWLGNAAAVCRVLLFVVPPAVFQTLPESMLVARTAFAVSGLLGLAAVWCLAINLWKTSSLPARQRRT